jgi:hypothetical protein
MMMRKLVVLAAALCSVLTLSSFTAASVAAGAKPGAAVIRTAAAQGTWGTAEQVPGLAALAGTGDSALNSVSCATAGNCSAGGFYHTGGPSQCCQSEAFVVSQVDGAWGTALEVPGIAGLNQAGMAEVMSVSCSSPGDCVAGGYYTSGHFPGGSVPMTSAFVVSQVNGTWGKARQVPGIAALNTGGAASITSVSCTSPGNCSAGGFYHIFSSPGCCRSAGFVISQVNATWGRAKKIPGTTGKIPGTTGINEVSCASPGNCGAAAKRVVSQVNGVWGAAKVVAVPSGSSFGHAWIRTISCAAPGDCSAGGLGTTQARSVVVNQVNGVWGTAREIRGTAALIKGKRSLVASVSCSARRNCTAGGYGFRTAAAGSSTRDFAVPYVAAQRKGSWGRAEKIPGIGTLSTHGYAVVTAVSCASRGNCAAAGRYSTTTYNPCGSGPDQVFVLNKANGTWGTPHVVTVTLGNDGPAQITAVACPAAGRCSAAGFYYSGAQERAFVISQS